MKLIKELQDTCTTQEIISVCEDLQKEGRQVVIKHREGKILLYDENECDEDTLVQHHIKYKEIHGDDEIVWMTQSEHRKLHARLRREGKCKISPEELRSISEKAYMRTERGKEKNRKSRKRFEKTEKGLILRRKYRLKNKTKYEELRFWSALGDNVSLQEVWSYYKPNGKCYITTSFHANHGLKLYRIDERRLSEKKIEVEKLRALYHHLAKDAPSADSPYWNEYKDTMRDLERQLREAGVEL